jgi:hypothetical protein
VGWFGSAEGAWVVVQVYESNRSDKQSSRLNMWSHPDAVASSVHQQQEMTYCEEDLPPIFLQLVSNLRAPFDSQL